MGKAGDRLEEGHDARVAEAQGGHALARFHGRALEPVQRVLGQDALMTDALHFEHLAIDVVPQIAQVGQVGDGLARRRSPSGC